MTVYRITLPARMPLLNSNDRQHHHARARVTASLREAACLVARHNRMPAMRYAHIVGVVHPGSRRRIDPANLYPSFKACVDGLVDAGVLPDDDSDHLVGPDMRRGSVVSGAQIALIVRPLTVDQHGLLASGEVSLPDRDAQPHERTGVLL